MRLQQHHRLAASFFLFSLITGALYSRMPDIQRALQVNEAQLGLTLIGGAIGSLISLTFSSPLIEKLGARTTGLLTLIGSTACYTSVTFLTFAPLAFAMLFIAGLLAGRAGDQSQRPDRPARSALQALADEPCARFLEPGLLRHVAGGGGHPAGGDPRAMASDGRVRGRRGGRVRHALGASSEAPVPETHDSQKPPLIAFPTLALLPLCLIGLVAFLIEGAGVDWSTIYMRDVFQAAPFIGGLGLTLFTAVMAAARIFLGPVVDRYSPRAVVTVLLCISIAGLATVYFAPHPYVAIIGFGMLGGGCSAIYPLVVSASAQRTDRPSSVNVAAVGQISFVVFFLAPPILGFVAHYVGIRWSYVVCLPLVIASLLAIRALPSRAKSPVPGEVLPEPLTPNG